MKGQLFRRICHSLGPNGKQVNYWFSFDLKSLKSLIIKMGYQKHLSRQHLLDRYWIRVYDPTHAEQALYHSDIHFLFETS